jgi:outer membrane lipoprotein-sorting protein
MIFPEIPASNKHSGVLLGSERMVREGGHPMSKVWLRWAPAAAAIVVVAGVAIAVPTVANASVSLPGKTPTQVLELVASSKVTAFSGTVEETSNLGLPSLPTGTAPSSSQSGTAADLALLTGSHSLRVYVDGPTRARVQDLESLAERDVIRDGSDVWVYDSTDNSVAHTTLTPRQHFVRPGTAPQATAPDPGTPDATDATPAGLAKKLIAQLEPSSTLSVDSNVRVAGRPAYSLVLRPKVTDTLIGSVSIAVDADTGLPLRVQVDARGQKTPAVSIGFSSINLSAPAASLFDFAPPAGAKVTEVTRTPGTPKAGNPLVTKPTQTVTGHAWDAVVTASAAGSHGKLSQSAEFGELTTAVTGGRLLHTSLFNVLFTTDGRIVAGSVSVARLQEVATAQ